MELENKYIEALEEIKFSKNKLVILQMEGLNGVLN